MTKDLSIGEGDDISVCNAPNAVERENYEGLPFLDHFFPGYPVSEVKLPNLFPEYEGLSEIVERGYYSGINPSQGQQSSALGPQHSPTRLPNSLRDSLDNTNGDERQGQATPSQSRDIAKLNQAAGHRIFTRRSRRVQARAALPLTIRGSIGITVIMAMADSGSEENVISLDLVRQYGIHFDPDPEHWKGFRMANGEVIRALGQILQLDCSFTKEPATGLACMFYVMERLITPLIIGMNVLQQTETLTKNRHRLQPLEDVGTSPLRLCSLNSPRRRLLCFVDSAEVFANADTGADMDLISLSCARMMNLRLEPITNDSERSVQFADGSCSTLSGKVVLQVAFGHREGPSFDVEFFVLSSLTCDVLLGVDILEEIDAFQTYSGDFITQREASPTHELCPVFWRNSFELFLSGHRHSTGMMTYYSYTFGSTELTKSPSHRKCAASGYTSTIIKSR